MSTAAKPVLQCPVLQFQSPHHSIHFKFRQIAHIRSAVQLIICGTEHRCVDNNYCNYKLIRVLDLDSARIHVDALSHTPTPFLSAVKSCHLCFLEMSFIFCRSMLTVLLQFVRAGHHPLLYRENSVSKPQKSSIFHLLSMLRYPVL